MLYSIPTYNKYAFFNDPSYSYEPPDPPFPPDIGSPSVENVESTPTHDISSSKDSYPKPTTTDQSQQDTSSAAIVQSKPFIPPVLHDILPMSSIPATDARTILEVDTNQESNPIEDTVQGFSDGGCLNHSEMSAGWWLCINQTVVHAKGELIHWTTSSNNVAEYFGLIRCLEATLDRGYNKLVMNMDSLLVVQQVLGHWECKNPCLIDLLQYARSLAEQLKYFTVQHTLREGNTVADALCNKAFDGYEDTNKKWLSTVDHTTAHQESTLGWSKWSTHITSVNWTDWWILVMDELKSFGPMIRNTQLTNIPSFASSSSTCHNVKISKKVTFAPLPITTPTMNTEWPFVIEPSGLVEIKKLAKECQIPWNNKCYKTLIPVPTFMESKSFLILIWTPNSLLQS